MDHRHSTITACESRSKVHSRKALSFVLKLSQEWKFSSNHSFVLSALFRIPLDEGGAEVQVKQASLNPKGLSSIITHTGTCTAPQMKFVM
jgi:hypothetical protein